MKKRAMIVVIAAVIILAAVIAAAYLLYPEGISDHALVTPSPTPQPSVTPAYTPSLTPFSTPTPEVTPNMTLNNYPELFGNDVMIVIGREARFDFKGDYAIANTLENLTGNKPAVKLDGDITENNKTECNLILVGRPNVNTVINDVYEVNPDMSNLTSDYPGRYKGIIELLKNPWNPDKSVLIIFGSDKWGEDTAIASLEQVCEINETSIIVEWKSERKEIHHDFDATPALAGLVETGIYNGVSNITREDIGLEVALTEEVHTLVRYFGKPMVPYIVKKFKIPKDSEVESVIVNFSDPIEIHSVFIEPAPKPARPIEYVIDNETYLSSSPYPGKESDYELSGDPIRGKEVVIHVFTIQYFPIESRILAYKNASVSIFYRVPTQEE